MFMVENIKNEINKDNIIVEIRRAEALSSWAKMTNEEKKAALTFEIWKKEVEQEFENKTLLFDIYNMKQKEEQKVDDFIKDVVSKCNENEISNFDRRNIQTRGERKS
ncbi:uncharacterized protein VNE69_05066 [Vairimorpha necatrix]|uniref:Uncharacterized protein n=1 Tax=Vairimorpha necatrix TaxID=6039 RepID=A0AAX4JC43_9MICR